ncbi:MAG: histone deacetylase family protein [Candidatus Latescibacteria bacterium]|nr:histone deacetylase family protein [Candidatus Latescibacterota bacterium]MCK5380625.1 histone deacetylase family protein [Candidatus Latescibacterota bacterium]
MKVVFHKDFSSVAYASNGASAPGRMEGIMEALEGEGRYEVVSPGPASYQDIVRVHSKAYVDGIAKDAALFEMASLAGGGAIRASEMALKNEPAFACIRPPGHHASKDSGWGYCVFCNMGIALLKLKSEGRIHSAFVLDFDAHTGDGTINVLSEWKEATVLNPMAEDSKDYLKRIEEVISDIQYVDLVAVSAGFDTYKKDLGKKLATFDFYLIGRLLRQFTKRMGHSRRFAVLEGGYYLPDLGKNVLAFCQGFE